MALSWGALTFNGAGFTTADDLYALDNARRPLLKWTYDFNARHGGWMLVNVALHAGAALAVLGLAGAWPAVLFAAHPIVADAVASVAGRSSLLCGMLVLCALLAYKHRLYWATGGLALLAFMAKEEAAMLLVLLPLCAFIWGRRRQAFLLLLVSSTSALALVPNVFRVARVAGVEQTLIDAGIKPPESYPMRVATSFSAVGSHALPRLFAPFIRLGAEPDARYSDIGMILTVWLLMVAFVLFLFKPESRLPLALLVVPLLVYVPVGLNDAFLEHRAYLAVAGVAMIVPRRLGPLALGFFMVMCNSRAWTYATSHRLWAEAVAQNPDSVRARINYGMILWSENDKDGADEQFHHAIPARAAYENLAALYINRHDFSHASEMMDLLEGRQ